MAVARLLRSACAASAFVLGCAKPPAPAPPSPAAPSASQAPAAPAPTALAEEPEPQPTELRTGRIAPIDHAEILALKVRRHAVDGDEQLLEVALPPFASETPGDLFWLHTEARLTGSSAPFQLVSRGKDGEMVLWLRRPKAESAGELAGDAYTPAVGAQPGHHFKLRAPAPSGAASPELVGEWAGAITEYLYYNGDAFGISAATRLQARYKLPGAGAIGRRFAPSSPNDALELAMLMDTFTGRSAVQAALAYRRGVVFGAAKQPRTVALAQVKGPALRQHPWAELSKRLGTPPSASPARRK